MAIRPRTFDIDCKLSYVLAEPCDFIFQVHALQRADQEIVKESLAVTRQDVQPHVYEDPHAGQRFLRIHASPGPLALRYRARVNVRRPQVDVQAAEWPISELPDEVLHHLLPSRYCESDRLGPAAVRLFGSMAPGAARVLAICDWIHGHVDYRIGSSDSTTTACDVFLRRAGVCRDFAQLAVTFCRALNIPARLAVGYAHFDTPPPDFHAMFEAFVGGTWVLFDPTRMADPRDLVYIAVGRDAKDVAFSTIYGNVKSGPVLPHIERVRA